MNSKRFLSMVLAMVLLCSNVLAAPIITVVDMPTGWSQPAVTEAVENGILTVENGEIRPMEPLTRAEMAEGITNAFGATEKASLSAYIDVPATKWYYEAMQKAVAMGIISGYGNGLIKPEKKITREEMFTVIYNALELEDGNLYFLNKFNDKNLVSDWAKFIVARMVQNNFVAGNAKGNIKPTESITREEFAQVMKNIFAEYYNVPGTYTNIPSGNIIVSTPNVILKDATVTGDLIIADGVGTGEVTLDNVNVLGRTIVRGGGENSVKLINNTTLNGNVIVNNNVSKVRIYNQKSQVKNIEVRTPAILEGDFENVRISKSTQVETKGNINNIIVDEKSDVMVTSGTVEQIDVKNTAQSTVISGKGKVTQVNANANDVTVSTSKTKVTAANNVTGVLAGKVSVEAGKTATVKSSSGGGGGGGSSSGGGGGSSSNRVTIPTLKLTDIANGGKIDLGANYGKFEVSYVYEDGYQTKWYTPTAKVLTESDNDVTKGWTSKTTIVKVKYGTSEKQLTIRPETPSFDVNKDGELVIPNFEQVKSKYEAKIDFSDYGSKDFIGQYKQVGSKEDLEIPTRAEEYLYIRLKSTDTMLASYPFSIWKDDAIVKSVSEVKYDKNNVAYRKIETDWITYIVTAENKNDKYLSQSGEGKTLFAEDFGINQGDTIIVYDIHTERANVAIDEVNYTVTDITNIILFGLPELELDGNSINLGKNWDKYQVAYGDDIDKFDTEYTWKNLSTKQADWYSGVSPFFNENKEGEGILYVNRAFEPTETGSKRVKPTYFGVRLESNSETREIVQVREIAEVTEVKNSNGYHTGIKVGGDYRDYKYRVEFFDLGISHYYEDFESSEISFPADAFVYIYKESDSNLLESADCIIKYNYEEKNMDEMPGFELDTKYGLLYLGQDTDYVYCYTNETWYAATENGYIDLEGRSNSYRHIPNFDDDWYHGTEELQWIYANMDKITIKDSDYNTIKTIELNRYQQELGRVSIDYTKQEVTVDDPTLYEYRYAEEDEAYWNSTESLDFIEGDVILLRKKGTDTKLPSDALLIKFTPNVFLNTRDAEINLGRNYDDYEVSYRVYGEWTDFYTAETRYLTEQDKCDGYGWSPEATDVAIRETYNGLYTIVDLSYLDVEEPVNPEDEIIPEEFVEAVEDLRNLGIMTGNAYGQICPEENITRAEMTVLIGKMMGLTSNQATVNQGYDSNFSDVKAGEWYTGWVNLVSGMGLISGFEDGTFRPNEKATQAQIITATVKALGWGEIVDASGEWPANYITKASELGLFEGAVNANSEYVIRGNAAIYIHNALDAETWSVGEGDSSTLREKYFSWSIGEEKAEVVEGIIDVFDVKDGLIALDGEEYKLSENVIVKIFGYNVGTGANAIAAIFGAGELDCLYREELTKSVMAECTLNEDDEVTEIILIFSKDGYNSTLDENLRINEFFVQKISANGKIKVNGTSLFDDLDDYSAQDIRVVKDGIVADIYDIEIGNVVTEVIYNNEVKAMYVSDDKINGTVRSYIAKCNEITVDYDSYKVIDVPFYNTDGEIDECIASTAEEIFDIFYYEDAEIYLNMVGEVVSVVGEIQMPQTVGVVSSVGDVDTDEETDEQYLPIRIFAEDGTNFKYKIFGNSTTDISTLTISEGTVVTFIANANNVIEIDKLKLITTEETDINTEMSPGVDVIIAETLVTDKENMTLNGYEVSPYTIIINAKEQELISWDTLVNQESDTVKTIAGSKAYLFVYDYTFIDDEAVYVVLWMDETNYGNIEENYGILLDTRKDKDEDAETIYIATMMINGREVEYECTGAFITAVNVGDFISFTAYEGVIKTYAEEYVKGEIINSIPASNPIDLSQCTNLPSAITLEAITVSDVSSGIITLEDGNDVYLANDCVVYNLEDRCKIAGVEEGDYVLFADKNEEDEYGIVIALWGGYDYDPPTFAAGNAWYKGETDKATLTGIVFTNTGNRTLSGDEIEYWNADAENKGDIFCYILDDVLYIDGNGNGQNKMYANENASFMFEGFGNLRTEWDGISYIENIDMLDTSKTTNMSSMFSTCVMLEELDLSNFDTSKVTDMSNMFINCLDLEYLDLSSFNTSNVTNMSGMFGACESLTDLDISNFNTSNVTTMNSMFSACAAIELDVSNFDTSKVVDMGNMFYYAAVLQEIDVSNFDTSKVVDMGNMFAYCASLIELDISNFETENVTNMAGMFSTCLYLEDLNMGELDTSAVTDMSCMFENCYYIEEIDLSSFVTSRVTDMTNMFAYCTYITELDLSNFNTSKVESMAGMFNECQSLNMLILDIDTSKVEDMTDMFNECNSLEIIKIGEDFAFVDGNHGFVAPDSYYIEGADGKWYNENGIGYTLEQVVARHSGENSIEATYYAVNPRASTTTTITKTEETTENVGDGVSIKESTEEPKEDVDEEVAETVVEEDNLDVPNEEVKNELVKESIEETIEERMKQLEDARPF